MEQRFNAKVPVTFTEKFIDGDNFFETTYTIGFLFTQSVLASIAFHREQTKELLKK